jgi:hypothetical protein
MGDIKNIDWQKVGKVAHTAANTLSFIYLVLMVGRQVIEINRMLNPKEEKKEEKTSETEGANA